MADEQAQSGPQFPCKYLRSHEGYFQGSPLDEEDPYSSGVYQCQRTHDAIGPDGEPVDRQECTPDRECFEELGT